MLHAFCILVLLCLGVFVLVVISPVMETTLVATEANSREEVVALMPGTSVRREIAGGDEEVFVVSAAEGTLLRFFIDKGDLALTTSVYDPTGVRLVQSVSEDFEMVELSQPIEVSGTYRIEIGSREKIDTPMPFELKVEPLTSISSSGREESEARRAMAEAGVLRAAWTETSLRQALKEYQKAAVVWTSVGNFGSASGARLRSGDIYFLLSDYAEALRRYEDALSFASRSQDDLARVRALNRMGRLNSYMGKNDLARDQLGKAWKTLGDCGAKANAIVKNACGESLSNLGEVVYSEGNMLKAAEQFKNALQFLAGDRKGQAKAHLFAGYIAGSGARERAIQEISQALALYQATNDKKGEGLALTTLGLARSFEEDQDQAIELHARAIGIFQLIGDRHSQAIALNAVGQAYERLNNLPAALSQYEQALAIFHDRGALDLESVTVLLLANIHRLSNRFEQALALYERGLKLSRAAGKQRTEANALSEMALVFAAQHRTEETLRQYRKLLRFYEAIGDRRGLAIALNAQGDFLLKIDRKRDAANTLHRAMSLSEKIGDLGVLIPVLHNTARAERALGHLDEALAVVKRSLKMIEDLRRNVGSPELRASYFSGVRKNYELCIDILSDLDFARPGAGYAAEAFLVSEKSRARTLVDVIMESEADFRSSASKELISRERELRALLRVQAQYQLGLKLNDQSAGEISEGENQIVQLTSEYQRVQAKLREQNPRAAISLTQFEPLSLQQVQDELGANDLLLEFSLGEEKSHLWAVSANSCRGFELPSRQVIEDAVIEYYGFVTARQRLDDQAMSSTYTTELEDSDKHLPQKARDLSQMLFGQVTERLKDKRLLLVTEGALQRVPFDALPVPLTEPAGAPVVQMNSRYLLEEYEIDALPSVATLRAIREARRQSPDAPDKIAAVIADPVFTRSDERVHGSPLSAIANAADDENRHESAQRALENLRRQNGPTRLIHASEEADAIEAVAPPGTTMVAKGFDASRETAVSSRLGEYQILHFATHGFLDDEHPELSSIILTMVDKNGHSKNGVLPLHDIYNLELSAELTVLSACQTALGKDIRGEGFMGLAHSFISAGSKSVVASLWKVDDRATATLMKNFYHSMLQEGMSPAAALRAAKLKVMADKRWGAPYYWAGFVVQGEYTNHITVQNHPWRRSIVVLLPLLVILSGLIGLKVRGRHGLFSARRP